MNDSANLLSRLSPSMRKQLDNLAEAEGASVDDFLVIVIAEKLARSEHRAWLQQSGTAELIASRKQQERLTRQLADTDIEQEFRKLTALFDDAPVFISVTAGPEHVFEMVNQSYLELMGPRQFIGKRVVDVVPEVAGTIWIDRLDHVYRTGEPWVERGARLSISTAQGKPLEDKFVDYTYKPRRGPDGTITGIVAICVHSSTVQQVLQSTGGGDFLLGNVTVLNRSQS